MTKFHQNAPRFYFDVRTGNWTSVESSNLPRVLVVSWHADPDSIARQIEQRVGALPANLVPVGEDAIPGILDELAAGRFVACVLLVSPRAIGDASLLELVQRSQNLFLTSPEFRLFAQLVDGLRYDDLKEKRDKGDKIAEALFDSVHLSADAREQGVDHAAILLQKHLLDLPRIRHRLARERKVAFWSELLSSAAVETRALTIIAIVVLLALGRELRGSPCEPWLYFGAGVPCFASFVALLTIGTSIEGGRISRFVLLSCPIAVLLLLPLSSMAAQWRYLVAGALAALVADSLARSIVMLRRRSVSIEKLLVDVEDKSDKWWCPGKHSLRFLAAGPWFPGPARAFVSYSDRSDWSRSKAAALHEELRKKRVNSFFAPESIEHGSSWRHRLATELRANTVFVQFLDAKTAEWHKGTVANKQPSWRPKHSRELHWPALELAAASEHQAVGGLPPIVIVCHSDMAPGVRAQYDDGTADEPHPFIARVLACGEDASASSLRIVEYEDGMEENLATELSQRYHDHAVSIMPIHAAAILDVLLMLPRSLMSTIGVLGSVVIWIGVAAVLVMWVQGSSLIQWLASRDLGTVGFLLAAFWLGCAVRFGVASRFEVWNKARGSSTVWRLLESVAFIGFCTVLGRLASTIAIVNAPICFAFGVMTGSDYLRRTADGGGWAPS